MKFDITKILDKFVAAFPIIVVIFIYLVVNEERLELIKTYSDIKDFLLIWISISFLVFSYLLGFVLEIISASIINLGLFKTHIENIGDKEDQENVHFNFMHIISIMLGTLSAFFLNKSLLSLNPLFNFFNTFIIILFVTFLVVLLLYYYVTK